LALAAWHGGVLNASDDSLKLAVFSEPVASPTEGRASSEHITALTGRVAIVNWMLAIFLIALFGVLATFTSPIFFLGVILAFIPLGIVAIRSA